MAVYICDFCGSGFERRSDAKDKEFCDLGCRSKMKRRVYMRNFMRLKRGSAPGPGFYELYPRLKCCVEKD